MQSAGAKPARNIRFLVAAGIAALAAVAFAATQLQSKPPAAVTGAASGPTPVTVASSTVKTITEWDEYTGRFAAVDSVQVRARVSGYLNEIGFKDGDIVKKGDLLFKIDPRPFTAALAAAKAELASADAALENARAEEERGRRLVERQALSKEEGDRRLSALREAKAARDAAKAKLDEAELNLEFSSVRAPISGRISDRYVSQGNLITGGPDGGTLLTTIVSISPIYFEFTASEADYLKYVRLAQRSERPSSRDAANPVFVKLIDETAFAHQGKMSFVDNQIDPSTGTMRGRATFDNSDGVFTPGMFGRLKLVASGRHEAVMIPDEAVQTDQTEKFVWIAAAGGKAERRAVKLGPLQDGLRIIRSGVSAKDKVVVAGTQFIQPGAVLAATEASSSRLAQAK